MGITLIEKYKSKKKGKKALVLAGGAVSGGAFMAGGIKALEDCFSDFTIPNFDTFVGISAGSMLAVPLAGGIKPSAILRSLDGTSRHFKPLTSWHYYRPHLGELLYRPIRGFLSLAGWFPKRFGSSVGGLISIVTDLVKSPNDDRYRRLYSYIEEKLGDEPMPSIAKMIPSGFFDNSAIEEYLRENIHNNRLTNSFKRVRDIGGKNLYIMACRLDNAERVIFGPDEKNDVTISKAVQASTAMPVFYAPANIDGVNYIDGGVQDTADLMVASKKGASLIVCYNPFRPYEEEDFLRKVKGRSDLTSAGLLAVINQVFRAFFRSRLQAAMTGLKNDTKFKGDVILIEPRPDDAEFFAINPLVLAHRLEAARLGYISTLKSIGDKFSKLKTIFNKHDIKLTKSRYDLALKHSKGKTNDKWREILEHVKPKRLTKKMKKR